jgi:hypothetical protein
MIRVREGIIIKEHFILKKMNFKFGFMAFDYLFVEVYLKT